MYNRQNDPTKQLSPPGKCKVVNVGGIKKSSNFGPEVGYCFVWGFRGGEATEEGSSLGICAAFFSHPG